MELEALAEQFYLSSQGRQDQASQRHPQGSRRRSLSRDLSRFPEKSYLPGASPQVFRKLSQEEYVEPKPLSGQEMEALRDNPGTDLDSKAIADKAHCILIQ